MTENVSNDCMTPEMAEPAWLFKQSSNLYQDSLNNYATPYKAQVVPAAPEKTPCFEGRWLD